MNLYFPLPVDPSETTVTATTSLARFLRENLRLTGTKISCNQAGCGACVVTAHVPNPSSGERVARSVNSVGMAVSGVCHVTSLYEQFSFSA